VVPRLYFKARLQINRSSWDKKKNSKAIKNFVKNKKQIIKRSKDFRKFRSLYKIIRNYKLIEKNALRNLEPSQNFLYNRK
jgi:hypothetical protein